MGIKAMELLLSCIFELFLFFFLQVYCEYRALLAEDATSSRQKNVRNLTLHDLWAAKFIQST